MTENAAPDELCFLPYPELLDTYRALRAALLSRWPDTELRPRRTQTGFAEKYLYAVASPGTRRLPGAPKRYVLLSLVLPAPDRRMRVAIAVEAAPGRWTHHLAVAGAQDIDDELLALTALSHAFALSRARGGF